MRKLGALISVPTHVANALKQIDKKEALQHILYEDTFASEVRDFMEIQSSIVEEGITILDDEKEVHRFISMFVENLDEQTKIKEFIQYANARNCLLIYYS